MTDQPRETKRAAILRLYAEGHRPVWIADHLSVSLRRIRNVVESEQAAASFPSPEERASQKLDTTAIIGCLRQVG